MGGFKALAYYIPYCFFRKNVSRFTNHETLDPALPSMSAAKTGSI